MTTNPKIKKLQSILNQKVTLCYKDGKSIVSSGRGTLRQINEGLYRVGNEEINLWATQNGNTIIDTDDIKINTKNNTITILY